MRRGRLKVFLGAAPGVGKTFAMLEEGRRLAELGQEVVAAVVDTHDRQPTAALLQGIELIPLKETEHRGARVLEMDLEAVLARRPEVALVDELAHANALGSAYDTRWQDVEVLLEAGITVLSTVNIQHLASLNDVVEHILGVPQLETIPDRILREADQTELVDISPQALRDRLAEGQVYPAAHIDAAVSNSFRIGNLTALRELALLWLAGEVDSALTQYRADHGIDDRWEARERVVVALTGGPEGETLLRRGARIAARSAGGDLLAVHVAGGNGLRDADPEALGRQRALVEHLGGTYHHVAGSDIPDSLVGFAREVNATQLVIGVSRRSRLLAFVTGPGIGARIIRASGDIDVHIVTHNAAGRQRITLPARRGALTVRRRIVGFGLALLGGPLLSVLLLALRTTDSLTADVLAYQLLVVVVALIGGAFPALFAAILSGLTLDFLFVDPTYQITVERPVHFVALLLYVLNALLVSVVVGQAARRTRAARRSAAESEMLASVAGGVIRGQDAIQSLVARTREAFRLHGVRLRSDGRTIAEDGVSEGRPLTVQVGARAELDLFGPGPTADDRRVLEVVVTQIDAALEQAVLASRAEEVLPLKETDRVRSALLAAVGHDLRRPLAVATAAVTGLRSPGAHLSDSDRSELLRSTEGALRNLDELITNLLDVSRVQAGALAVSLGAVDVEDLLPAVLEELRLAPGAVELTIPPDLPAVRADAILLQRAIVNIVANALRFSPPGHPPRISASVFGERAEVRIADRGPGVPADRRAALFQAFQRSGDTDNTTGIGLGLALSQGFVHGMGGTLEPEDTPGGGLTMVIALPLEPASVEPTQSEAALA
jgi:two-component system sensor histidine kinase KdpD